MLSNAYIQIYYIFHPFKTVYQISKIFFKKVWEFFSTIFFFKYSTYKYNPLINKFYNN